MTPDEEAIADVIGQSIRIALPKQLLPIIERLARLEQKFDQLDARGPLGERTGGVPRGGRGQEALHLAILSVQ